MALADSHSRLLSAIDDYGEFGRKQNRKEGVMRGLEMLNESLSAAMERRRRKKEREEEIKIRERERAEDKTFALEQDMVNRQTAEIEENAQAARKRQEKKREEEELNAKIEPHLPIVKQVRELLAQADSSLDDPVAKHQYLTKASHLTYDLPKEVTDKYPWLDDIGKDKKALEAEISADKKEAARAAREAAKNDPSANPEWQRVVGEIDSELERVLQDNPEMKLPILLLKAEMRSKTPNPDRVYEMYNGILDGIKSGGGTDVPSSLSGRPLTKQQSDEASTFSYEPELTDEAEQGAALFGGTGELLNTPDSLYTPTKPLDQFEYMVQQETEALIESKAYPDTPRGRAFARTKATEKVEKQFPGKAPKKGKYQPDKSVLEGIMNPTTKAGGKSLAQIEAEVRAKCPDLETALEGDPMIPGSVEAADNFRRVLDSTYFEGLSDYLSYGVLRPDVIEPSTDYGLPRE